MKLGILWEYKNIRKVLLFGPTSFILAKMLRFFGRVPYNSSVFICEILLMLSSQVGRRVSKL
jgi:hypothetical protein